MREMTPVRPALVPLPSFNAPPAGPKPGSIQKVSSIRRSSGADEDAAAAVRAAPPLLQSASTAQWISDSLEEIPEGSEVGQPSQIPNPPLRERSINILQLRRTGPCSSCHALHGSMGPTMPRVSCENQTSRT